MSYGDPLPPNTFWQDFTIADKFGEEAVRDTYKRSQHWLSDVDMWSALVVVLNHKIWKLYQTNEPLARVYDELWKEAHAKGWDTYKGEEAKRYFDLTD